MHNNCVIESIVSTALSTYLSPFALVYEEDLNMQIIFQFELVGEIHLKCI